jgi:Ca2+-transporting ATPase
MHETGLSEDEARRIRARVGPNRVPEPGAWRVVFLEARRLLTGSGGLLLVVAALSAWLGRGVDALSIALAVTIASGVDVVLSSRSRAAIRELGRWLAATCRVVRESRVRDLPCEELVPGDLVAVEPGDRLGADGVIVVGRLLLDESLLTGESYPVHRMPGELATGGTWVRAGRGRVRITGTGARSRIGRLGGLVGELQLRTAPVQRHLDRLGARLMVVAVALSGLLVLLGLWRGHELASLLESAVVLAVAAIPEALPSVATIALAHVSLGLSGRGIRVQNLAAIETLGRVNVLGLDKTGTLTTQCIQLAEVVPIGPGGGPMVSPPGAAEPDASASSDLLAAARFACVLLPSADGGWQGDPLDLAIAEAVVEPEPGTPVSFEHEASPEEPWSEVWRGDRVHRKGAPEVLLARATETADGPLTADLRAAWEARARQLGTEGARVLGVSRATIGSPEIWLGLLAFRDPQRPDAGTLVTRARELGIEVWMLTGDHVSTARALAGALGIPGDRVLARATPERKLAWVQERLASGDVVGMAGDGVNDAPALAQASVGIALVSGTDVARQTADAVLTTGSLVPLLEACEAGRHVTHRLQQACDYLVTCSLTTVACALMATMLGWSQPLRPTVVLYLNLLTHVWPAIALATRSDGSDVHRPVSTNGTLLGPARLLAMGLHVVSMAAAALAAGALGAAAGEDRIRSLVFATLALSLMAHVVVDSSRRPFGGWHPSRLPGGPWLLQGLAIALPLVWPAWARWLGLGVLDSRDWVVACTAATLATCLGEVIKMPFPPEAP